MIKPDLIIGPREAPQTLRWHIFNLFGWQFAIHKWLRSDSDRAPHDHKADNVSVIFNGGYFETIRVWLEDDVPVKPGDEWKLTYDGNFYRDVTRFRWPLVPYFRKAETLHRVSLLDDKPVWTLWIRGPQRREWGYWCDNRGWVHNEVYNKKADYYAEGVSEVGQGCD